MNNTYDTQRPYLATYIILRKQNQVAMLLRTGTPWMNGHYGLPAGKVEKGESFLQTTIREAKEEVGIDIDPDDLRLVLTQHYNEPDDQDNSWINLFFEVEQWQGVPVNREPHRHGELTWFELGQLPENILPNVRSALLHIEAGRTYADFIGGER